MNIKQKRCAELFPTVLDELHTSVSSILVWHKREVDKNHRVLEPDEKISVARI